MSVGQAKKKMSRRPLGSLASYVNAHGEEVLSRRVGRERTHLERQAARMYERGEKTWRRLTRERVAVFFELFLLAMVRTENAHLTGYPQAQSVEMLLGTLVQRIIPWVYRHRVWTKYEGRWPMSLEHFHELDNDLANYLPGIHEGHQWQRIRVYFGDMKRVREERRREEQERRQRAIRLSQVRRVLEL